MVLTCIVHPNSRNHTRPVGNFLWKHHKLSLYRFGRRAQLTNFNRLRSNLYLDVGNLLPVQILVGFGCRETRLLKDNLIDKGGFPQVERLYVVTAVVVVIVVVVAVAIAVVMTIVISMVDFVVFEVVT